MRYNQIDAMYEKGTTRTTHGMIGRSCALMVDSVHQSKLWVIFIVVHSTLDADENATSCVRIVCMSNCLLLVGRGMDAYNTEWTMYV
jgi:hypothetical protein